jgi:hypothetical protein
METEFEDLYDRDDKVIHADMNLATDKLTIRGDQQINLQSSGNAAIRCSQAPDW